MKVKNIAWEDVKNIADKKREKGVVLIKKYIQNMLMKMQRGRIDLLDINFNLIIEMIL